MDKGFSSKVTEELYNYVIAQDLRGEQICELANRLHEYGSDKQWKKKRKENNPHEKDYINRPNYDYVVFL